MECTDSGIDAEISDRIEQAIWEKFVFLVGLSGTISLARTAIGPVRSHPRSRAFLHDVMAEVVQVGRAQGVALPADYADERLAFIDQLPATATSSMQHDLERGNRLEVDWLSGDVVKRGARRGVPTPGNRAGLKQALDDGVAQLGRLDIVCSNAGIASFGQAAELDETTWQDMIDIQLTGMWHACKAAIPHLVAGGRGGSIVITSSTAGLKGFQNLAHYVSAKHGAVGLMRTLALELAPHFIRVNTVHPTGVNTPMIHNEPTYRLFLPDVQHPTREQFAEAYKAINALPVPWVEPADISNAVLFLASDEARYVTGVTFPVDAGFTLK